MKSFTYLHLVTALCAGLSSIANAHFTGPTVQDVHPDNPTVTLAAAQEFFGDPNLAQVMSQLFEAPPEIRIWTDKGWYRW